MVLYFYPRADTPGCTTQACGVRDHAADYDEIDARVIGISPDPVTAVGKFADKYDLGFTLLADEDHAVADAYGTWVEKSMYGKTYMGVQRATFIIDADGRLRRSFRRSHPRRTTTRCWRRSARWLADRLRSGEGEDQRHHDVDREELHALEPGRLALVAT